VDVNDRSAMPASALVVATSHPVHGAPLGKSRSEPAFKKSVLGNAGQLAIGGSPPQPDGGSRLAMSKHNSKSTGALTRETVDPSHWRGIWGNGPQRAGAYTKRLNKKIFKKSGIFSTDTAPVTEFRRFFERGDIPIAVRHGAKTGVEWKVEPDKLDYMHYLPIFFDGLLEKQEPFATLAEVGTHDMLRVGRNQILKCVPSLIIPLKKCLDTRDAETMSKAINALQKMITSDDKVGEALVPYYRQILPVFNLYKGRNRNLGDGIDYAQRKRQNMGDLIEETLALMEQYGGEDAFINIKYMIPTFQSVSN